MKISKFYGQLGFGPLYEIFYWPNNFFFFFVYDISSFEELKNF